MYGKAQIVTRRFLIRLHASNFGIQILSHNIKIFNSRFFKQECYKKDCKTSFEKLGFFFCAGGAQLDFFGLSDSSSPL